LHRLNALAVLLAIGGCAVMAWRNTARGALLRKVSALWVGVVLMQVVLGILSILSQRKVDVTTAHVAVGALTLAVGWMAVLIVSRSVATKPVPAALADEVVTRSVELTHA